MWKKERKMVKMNPMDQISLVFLDVSLLAIVTIHVLWCHRYSLNWIATNSVDMSWRERRESVFGRQ